MKEASSGKEYIFSRSVSTVGTGPASNGAADAAAEASSSFSAGFEHLGMYVCQGRDSAMPYRVSDISSKCLL